MTTVTESKLIGKQAAAKAALHYVEDNAVIGVGSGSTAEFFIAELATIKHQLEAAVASSVATLALLKNSGIPVVDLNSVTKFVYIDGADEINRNRQMIKGGGGAFTREKIIATVADKFICIVDESKVVDILGDFPIAVEVIPLARSYVGRQIVKLGGEPVYREGFTTDNGNIIIDVYGLPRTKLAVLEVELKNMVGVVENGIFIKRPADLIIVGHANGDVTYI